MLKFEDLGLAPLILTALEKIGYKEPSDIQALAIPLIMKQQDLIVTAQTGSGKTATCAIPICHRVKTEEKTIQALIIVPTRELAGQYATETQKIGSQKGVKTFAIYGGEDASLQQSKLNHGVHVLVATPGRLIDFIYSRQIDLSHVETLILDEADEMLSMGFYEDLEFIIQCLIHPHQTLLFSATMPKQIRMIAKQHMQNPLEISLLLEPSAPKQIAHQFFYCQPHERKSALLKLIREASPEQAIVFCRSRHECEEVTRALKQDLDGIDFLHAGLTQDIRNIVISKFRAKRLRILIATDIVSRGLDFSGISHIFIYHLGEDPDVYVHRSGRTGRFDKPGTVVTLITDRERAVLERILKQLDREPIWLSSPPPLKSKTQPKPFYKKRSSS